MTNKATSVLFLLFITSFLGCSEGTKPTSQPAAESIGKKIEAILTKYQQKGALNGNVLVRKDGLEIFHKSYGYSDASKQHLLELDYRFAIGSIYKEFPAVLIMRLQEKKQLNLEDKIDQYLPELPGWSKEISILNLLQYTSGLPTIDWVKYFSKDQLVKDEDIWNDLLSLEKLAFIPGTDYIYSNNNPYLLIKIIEQITKQTFDQYIQEELFTPLKMEGTVIKNQYPYLEKTAMAIPFNVDFEEDAYKINTPTLLFTSTTKDLYHWFSKLNSFEIISEASINIIAKTAELKGRNMQAPLGICTFENGKIKIQTHHGSMGNYDCLVQRLNQEDLTVIILSNQKKGNLFKIAAEIISLVEEQN